MAEAQAVAAERVVDGAGPQAVAGVYRRRADEAARRSAERPDDDLSRTRSIHVAIAAGRARLLHLHRERRLAEGVLQALEHELDLEATREWTDLGGRAR